MELPHLSSFLVLAEELHFGRAADRLGLTQPSLSRQIQQLETVLNVSLFDRSNKTVRLTRAGEVFLGDARKQQAAIQDAVKRARLAAAGSEDVLHVAFCSSFATSLVAPLVESMRATPPSPRLILSELPLASHANALHSGDVDVTVSYLPVLDGSLMRRTLYLDPLFVMLPATHALALHPRVSLSEIANETLVLCPSYRDSGFHEALLEKLRSAGFSPTEKHEVDSKTLAAEMVARGMGMAFVTESAVHDSDDVIYLPITDRITPFEIALLWVPQNESPALRLFIDNAVQQARLRQKNLRNAIAS